MATVLTSYPFDTQSVSEAQWGQMAQLWLADGVLPHILNEFAVSGFSGGMFVHVESGRCWLQGFFGENASQRTPAIATADATNARIDRVVIRVDLANNQMVLDVVTGTPAGSPAAPSLTRNATVWEISLAQVAVAAGATSIASGNVTDERFNPAVCGFAYSNSPALRCKSTSRPTSFPIGGLIWEEDTGFLQLNTGTYGVPVWTRAGPVAFAAPTIAFSNVAATGVATTYIRSDATLAVFDATVPSTQAIGDAAAVGVVNFAARRDHKHAMPAFAAPTITLGGAAAAGAAATLLRSDATIQAFTASNPAASAPGDAAAQGTSNFAARLDHIHARENNPHLSAFKTTTQDITLNAGLINDTALFVTIPANSKWQFEFQLTVAADSDTPDIQLQVLTDAASGTLIWMAEGYDASLGPPASYGVQRSTGFAATFVLPLLLATPNVPVRLWGYLDHTGGSTTVLRLKWAQNASNASATHVNAGSTLLAHRLA